MKFTKQQIIVICILLAVFFGGGVKYGGYLAAGKEYLDIYTDSSQSDEIVVNIIGEVKTAGSYTLPLGSSLDNALELAGVTDNSDLQSLDLSRVLTDGESITVASVTVAAASDSTGNTNSSCLININSNDVTTLQQLNGIGEVKAAAIIAYRQDHGDFNSIEEIRNVSGIGNATYEKIKDYICVD